MKIYLFDKILSDVGIQRYISSTYNFFFKFMVHFVWSQSWMTSLLIFVVKVKLVCQPINN